MEFSLILYFLYGISIKIYDDIIDEKLNIDIFYIDLLKYFAITLYSIFCYNSGVSSTIFFVSFGSTLFMDKYYTSKLEYSKDTNGQKDLTCFNDNFWRYSFILSGVAVIYHISVSNNFTTPFSYKNITFFINLINICALSIIDIYYTPEHSSDKKLYFRAVFLTLFSIFLWYMIKFSDYIWEGNYGCGLIIIGFTLTSVCFLTLDKFHVFDYLKNKESVIEVAEEKLE